jgi:hypothetical protein
MGEQDTILRAAPPRKCAEIYSISYRCMRKWIDQGIIVPRRAVGSVRSLVLFSDMDRAISEMAPTTRRRSTPTAEVQHATA